jgi:uncharacterized protein with HEPN domain
VTRGSEARLRDILDAIERCTSYQGHLRDSDGTIAAMAYDAVLCNLAVIGEAARSLPPETKALFDGVPWAGIAGLRNVVVHEYFRIREDLVLDKR